LVVSNIPLAQFNSTGIFFTAYGLMWLICGSVALWSYLRAARSDANNGPPNEEAV
jgi:hypothetical protein